VPFLHDKLVWNVKLVEHKVEYIDVVSGRGPIGVDEFEGTEIPVAYND
jgi:hypothetical protein